MGGPFDQLPRDPTVDGVARWTLEAGAALNAKLTSLGGQLGRATGAVSRVTGAIFTLPLEAGQLYWHPEAGAHEVHGPVREHYDRLLAAKGFLGAPTTDVTATPDGGRYNHFQGGSIYWHDTVGACEVHGEIRAKWAALGWEQGLLGYPVSDEKMLDDHQGRVSHFQRGSIYWHPSVGAFEVHGEIRKRWAELGWEQSYLGYPISDEGEAGVGGRFSQFQRGFLAFLPPAGVIEFPANMVFKSGPIVTDTSVGGWVELALNSRGDFNYRGHLHNSGFTPYRFAIATGLKLPGDNQALLVSHSGKVQGTEVIAPDRDDDWSESGNSSKIRERWADLGGAVMHTKVDLTGDLSLLATVVINVLVATFAVILHSDPNKRSKGCVYTDMDGNERREIVIWDKNTPEPPCDRGF